MRGLERVWKIQHSQLLPSNNKQEFLLILNLTHTTRVFVLETAGAASVKDSQGEDGAAQPSPQSE